jgi:O-antigen ligase
MRLKVSISKLFFAPFALILFYFFYLKYVPLIPTYQLVLIPILISVFVLTIINKLWGLFLFVILFPLINCLPYFFGLYENIPQAPTALILFLAFFLALLWRHGTSPSPSGPSLQLNLWLYLFALLVLVSGLMTIFRFSNFFPILSDGIYEWRTNVNNVSAGGAIMSSIFNLLNYLTGMALFLIVSKQVKGLSLKRKILNILIVSASLSLTFALIQLYLKKDLANTPFWVKLGQINATFKDPNSAAAFFSAVIPILLATSIISSKKLAWPLLGLSLVCLHIVNATGSRSAFLGLIFSLIIFTYLIFKKISWTERKRKNLIIALILISLVALVLINLFASNRLASRLRWSFQFLNRTISLNEFFNRRLYYWQAALAMVSDYPFSGVGLGAYIIELPNYLKELNLPFRETDSALNHFLQVAAELGLMGALLVIVVAVTISKYLLKILKSGPARREEEILNIGLIASLTSLATNFLFHTFIGSYEIKYFLWLLLALLLNYEPVKLQAGDASLLAPAKSRSHKKLSFRLFPLFAGLAILIYTLSLLWASTHSLSLSYRTKHFNLLQEFGLDRVERTAGGQEFRWSGKTAALPLHISGNHLVIPLHVSHPDIHQKPVEVKLALLDANLRYHRFLGQILFKDHNWHEAEFDLSKEIGTDKILLIKVSRTWNPYRQTKIKDLRNLGVAIGRPYFR